MAGLPEASSVVLSNLLCYSSSGSFLTVLLFPSCSDNGCTRPVAGVIGLVVECVQRGGVVGEGDGPGERGAVGVAAVVHGDGHVVGAAHNSAAVHRPGDLAGEVVDEEAGRQAGGVVRQLVAVGV